MCLHGDDRASERAIAVCNVSIPDHLSLVTLYDVPWPSLYKPPITRLERPQYALASGVCVGW